MSDVSTQHEAGDLATVTRAMGAVDPAVAARTRELKEWEDIAFVLRSKDFEPPGREGGFGAEWQAHLIGESLVEVRGDDHFERRRLESVLFRRDTLLDYERELVLPSLRREVGALAETRDADGLVRTDLLRLAKRVSVDLMTTLVGLDGIEDEEAISEFAELYEDLDVGVRAKYTTGDPGAVVARALDAQRRLVERHFRPSWQRREQLLRDGAEAPNDLITLMIRHPEHYGRWDRELVEREATLFMTASVTTTGNEVCHAVREIEGWIAAHPEDAEKRTDEAWLAAAFNESARLHAFGWMVRLAVRDTQLPDGTSVQQGDLFWLDFRAAYDELYGGDASRFDPSRRQTEELAPYGLAFGNGRHTCIGKMLVLGDGATGTEERRGTARTILLELYGQGMRLDPERPPQTSPGSVREMVESCPIVLTAL
jgi:cytochrome P450